MGKCRFSKGLNTQWNSCCSKKLEEESPLSNPDRHQLIVLRRLFVITSGCCLRLIWFCGSPQFLTSQLVRECFINGGVAEVVIVIVQHFGDHALISQCQFACAFFA